MESKDTLGDRMKGYEEEGHWIHSVDPSKPWIARLDGRSFSRFTKQLGLAKPFDVSFRLLMLSLAKSLKDEFNASFAYSQSDEITLIFPAIDYENGQQNVFGGKVQKLNSVMAGYASAKFVRLLDVFFPNADKEKTPHFDCRIFNVPSETEASNCLIWRVKDSYRNAVSMIAQANFSHKELQGKKREDMIRMLSEKDIELTDFPEEYMYGFYLNKDGFQLILSDFVELANREDVIFRGESPIFRDNFLD